MSTVIIPAADDLLYSIIKRIGYAVVRPLIGLRFYGKFFH